MSAMSWISRAITYIDVKLDLIDLDCSGKKATDCVLLLK